jgi:hypothetical protein
MNRQTILPIIGLLFIVASFIYTVMLWVSTWGTAMIWMTLWQPTLPLVGLVLLAGSTMIRFGPEHVRPTADGGLSCTMFGIGITAICLFCINSNVDFSAFFGCLGSLILFLGVCIGLLVTFFGLVLSCAAAVKGFGTPPPVEPGHCQVCGYNRTGLPKRRCPECGTPF